MSLGLRAYFTLHLREHYNSVNRAAKIILVLPLSLFNRSYKLVRYRIWGTRFRKEMHVRNYIKTSPRQIQSVLRYLLRQGDVLSTGFRHSLMLHIQAFVENSAFLTRAQIVQIECDLWSGEPITSSIRFWTDMAECI